MELVDLECVACLGVACVAGSWSREKEQCAIGERRANQKEEFGF